MAVKVYVALEILKEAIGIGDALSDNLLNRALDGASRSIDDATGRRFWIDDAVSARIYRPTGRTLWTDGGEHQLLVDDIATTTGLIVETGSTASGWTAVTGYETTPDNALAEDRAITGLLLPSGYWPSERGQRVRVTAKWGWPVVPDQIEQACLTQAARFYRRKDSPQGVMGSAEWGAIRVSRLDPDVKALIEHLVLPGFG